MTSAACPRAAVSIVVNTYNGALYLNECIASILALKGPFDLEIIVIDDASTDETRAVVSGFRDPRIRFLRHEINRGAAAAINTAFAVASGEFIARIDYDDRYLPEFLVRAVAALQDDPAVGLVCGAVEMIDTHGQRCGHASPTQHGISIGAADHFVSLLRHNFITAPTILGRATAWRTALPVPDGLNFADWYISLKMAEISKICVLDSVLAEYRVHPAGMHSTMVLDGTGERMSNRILSYFLAGNNVRDDVRLLANQIRARHAAEWGDRYFGSNMNDDARRCYLCALKYAPVSVLGHRGRVRRSLGLILGRQRYEALKNWVLRAAGKSATD